MFMPNVVNTKNDTYYSILGISNKASADEIKKAYRKLSLDYHPDRNNNNPEKAEIYKKITAAYNILSNEHERTKYDFSLTHGSLGIDMDPAFFMNMFMNPMDAQTILNELTNLNCSTMSFGKPTAMGGDPFASLPFGRSFKINKPDCLNGFSKFEYNSKPKTISTSISITLLDSYKGHKYPLTITRWIIEADIKQEQNETIYINIPKGIDNNEIITIKNKGNKISDTNQGDIEIKININNETCFERNGIDLIFKKSITLKESFCGFSFDLPYIDGREFKINNEAGNVIPQDFRKIIPKLGMERDGEHGNLIIIFDIIYPKNLSNKQIEQLKEIL